ncbi:MAG: hypothetical protein QW348_02525 [Ignisphaera sp.]
MKRLSSPSLRRIYEQTAYMANRRMRSYSIAVIITDVITALFILMLGWQAPVTVLALLPLVPSISIYKIVIAAQISGIAREIKSGEVQLYLAHTLTRVEYLLSTFLLAGITPALLLVSTCSVVIAIVAPNLLYTIGEYILYIFVDLLIFSAIVVLVASHGYEGTTIILGVFLGLFIWIATSILLFFYTYSGLSYTYSSNVSPLSPPLLYLVYLSFSICALLSPFTYRVLYIAYTQTYKPSPPPIPPPTPQTIMLLALLLTIALLGLALREIKVRDI